MMPFRVMSCGGLDLVAGISTGGLMESTGGASEGPFCPSRKKLNFGMGAIGILNAPAPKTEACSFIKFPPDPAGGPGSKPGCG